MNKQFALGVDLGWVSQLEAEGVRWVDHSGEAVDPILTLKSMGADSVRLRVFVNPPSESYWQKKDGTICMLGFCDARSVAAMSKRVKSAGMRLMIDFHYSDHFADPQYQDIPEQWLDKTPGELTELVYQHTRDVLELLKEEEITPEWVQVGNEINPGILLPMGSLKEHPDHLIAFLNAGYDAVKACFPECKVITHITASHLKEWCVPFLDNFFARNGKTDILGFSHYPYWFQLPTTKEFLLEALQYYKERYQKPIMVCEVGAEETDADGCYNLLVNTIDAVCALPNDEGLGVFYWEPEVGADLLPDHYPLGSARVVGEKTLQFTDALTAYGKYPR